MNNVVKHTAILYLLSIPLWIVGFIPLSDYYFPVNLPISALQFLLVIPATMLMVKKSSHSIKEFMRDCFTWRFNNQHWIIWIVATVSMPLIHLMSYNLFASKQTSMEHTPPLMIPVFVMLYLFSATCEQIGWTAYQTNYLIRYKGTLLSGFIVGLIWAVWHIVPFIQTHNSWEWIIAQCFFTIGFRILLTKFYVLTGYNVYVTIVMQMLSNVTFSMLPYYGSTYDPRYASIILLFLIVIVFVLYPHKKPMVNNR